MTAATFRAGGRTRLVGLTASVGILLLVLFLRALLGAIPRAVVIGLLFIVSISAFDRWSVRLCWDALRGRAQAAGQRAYYDLAVVFIIMAVTLIVSIVPAIMAGFAAACISFAMNMSRPIVRRRLIGLRSKHVRTAVESALLRQSSERWTVLRLSGVLFFGNCETLSREIVNTFTAADIVVLDCRNVTDIDASGENSIREAVDKSRKLGKSLLFCNVPAFCRPTIDRIAGNDGGDTIFGDLDSALEWIEDGLLKEEPELQTKSEPLSLEEHDFFRGLSEAELGLLASLLSKKEFARGAALATEGEPGDRMWLIMKGCVNILLHVHEQNVKRRIASLATGTAVGEMSLVENANRSASIVAAEDIVCWELDRRSYEKIMRDYPEVGTKLLTNLIKEMAHRIRNTSEQLRETES